MKTVQTLQLCDCVRAACGCGEMSAAEKREREREKAARRAKQSGPREENDVEEEVEDDEEEEEDEDEFDGPDPRIAQVPRARPARRRRCTPRRLSFPCSFLPVLRVGTCALACTGVFLVSAAEGAGESTDWCGGRAVQGVHRRRPHAGGMRGRARKARGRRRHCVRGHAHGAQRRGFRQGTLRHLRDPGSRWQAHRGDCAEQGSAQGLLCIHSRGADRIFDGHGTADSQGQAQRHQGF